MHQTFIKSTVLLIALFKANAGSAIPPSKDLNLREACRQAVAGEFMSAYDAHKTSAGYLKELEEMTRRVITAVKIEKLAMQELSQKVEAVAYDVELADKVIQQREKVKSLEETADLYNDQMTTAREKLVVMANRADNLKKSIQPVFDIVWSGDVRNYPVGVKYKIDCPKYRSMCPLPLKFHEPLKKIMLKDDSEVACSRYVSFSKKGAR
jgi:hypothetical protein